MIDLREAVTTTLNYCRQNNIHLPEDITRSAKQLGLIPSARKAGDYSSIRDQLYDAIYNAVDGFLSGNAQVGTYSRPMATAVSQAYLEASEIAYTEGGGALPLDNDTAAWVRGELDAQLGFVDSLFETLKALRKEGDFESVEEAINHAERWASGLDGFFNAVKIQGAGNMMLTWQLGGTEKHCKDCLRLNGQRHRASWYISRGYTPRKGGSMTDCGGWNCDCQLVTDDGDEFTI
jgi:hypothetical protein